MQAGSHGFESRQLHQPQTLVDAGAIEQLRSQLADAVSDNPEAVDSLLDSLTSALSGGVEDVFMALFIVAALSFAIALFFRVQSEADKMADPEREAASDANSRSEDSTYAGQ